MNVLRAQGHSNFKPHAPTLERLNIEKFDSKANLAQIQVKNMREYIEKYKKELKTVDIEAIKKVIFQKIYTEIIGIEARKQA